ncbi:MAG: enoyl-ACP reductase, partial [Mobilicoccus sp.]|nr:enoyl-ACP reductase [Mobilicoccus sp.]
YGPDFRYRELSDVGAGLRGPVRAAGMAAGLGLLFGGLALPPTRWVLDRFLPEPGEGPDADARARGRFSMEITANTESGARYRTVVAADHDPGYGGTAIMLGQSALALALDALDGEGGVQTPAVALGSALVERLRKQGFTLTAIEA